MHLKGSYLNFVELECVYGKVEHGGMTSPPSEVPFSPLLSTVLLRIDWAGLSVSFCYITNHPKTQWFKTIVIYYFSKCYGCAPWFFSSELTWQILSCVCDTMVGWGEGPLMVGFTMTTDTCLVANRLSVRQSGD